MIPPRWIYAARRARRNALDIATVLAFGAILGFFAAAAMEQDPQYMQPRAEARR